MEKGRLGSGNTLSFQSGRQITMTRKFHQKSSISEWSSDREEEKGGISGSSISEWSSDREEEKNSAGILRPDNRVSLTLLFCRCSGKPPSSPDGLSGQRRFAS